MFNRAIDLMRRDILLDQETVYIDNAYAHIMPLECSLDVDCPWDLRHARPIVDNMGQESV
jgi:CMP-N-acetylneuraminic acid synthetase